MPPTRTISNTELGIRLQGGQTEYAPGDIVVGYVVRGEHLVTQFSSLSIQLVGRTISKMAIISETGLSRYHGVFNLIPRHHKQKLHQGSLCITGGDEKLWCFAIKIPKFVDPEDFNMKSPGESYLSLKATNNPLPSTFTLFGGVRTEAFVEYFVKASLRSKGESCEGWVAKLPITIANHHSFVGSRLRTQSFFHSVVSYGLLAGMKETKLSLFQIVKQAMKSSSVPKFGFKLEVDIPQVIQINDPNPIPVRLRALMSRKSTTDDIKNTPPKIKLKWMSIQIIAHTEAICQGPHTMQEESEIDLDIMKQISIQGQDVYLPCTKDNSSIDIGDLIDLRLDRYYNVCHPHQGPVSFTPNFETYNIRRSHRLKWMLAIELAGQVIHNTEIIMLTILGPSGVDEPMPGSQDTQESGSQSSEADGRGSTVDLGGVGDRNTPRIE